MTTTILVTRTKTKRNRLETLEKILTVSMYGVKKTHILYRANLNHQQLEKLLEFLICKGLIIKEGKYYRTTSKGIVLLEEFHKIRSLMLTE